MRNAQAQIGNVSPSAGHDGSAVAESEPSADDRGGGATWNRIVKVLSHRSVLVHTAGAGLAFRVVLLVAGRHRDMFYDEHDYSAIAKHILSGEGFSSGAGPTSFRPPLTPLITAALYALGPHPWWTVGLLQSIALCALPFAVASLAKRLGLGPAGANIAAALAAFHPGIAYASITLYPTVWTTVGIVLGLAFVGRALADSDRKASVAAGVALGLAGAATTYFAALPVIAALVLGARRKLIPAALVFGVGLAPAVAWSLRNHVSVGTGSLSTNGGYNLALGANDRATPRSGNWVEPDLSRAEVPDDERLRDAAYRASAMHWIRENPGRYAYLAFGRGLAVFDSVGKPRTRGVHESKAARAAGWLLTPWVALGVAGLWIKRRDSHAWLTIGAFALVVAVSAATIVKPRFRFPLDPALAPFAVIAAASIFKRGHRRTHEPTAAVESSAWRVQRSFPCCESRRTRDTRG
jgi:4-amino-4-deoxy-L-arabinose transferase-like glycosyltransferase